MTVTRSALKLTLVCFLPRLVGGTDGKEWGGERRKGEG